MIPHWNPVSPPQLPRDAPVLNALQPVIENLRPAIRVKLHFALRHHRLRGGHAGIFQEPLFAEARFDRYAGAFAVADGVLIWLRLHQSACGLHEFRGFLPGRESFQSDQVRASLGRHFAVGGEHIDDRESMTLADFEVRLVVRGSHFQNAGAKFEIHMLVSDDGDQALLAWLLKRQRTQDHLANQMGVARIFRIHRHRGIGRDRLRSRRGNGQERAGLFGEFHLEIIHETILRPRVHLLIGQCREAGWAPVHHALAAVDHPLFVKVHEHPLHTPRVILIHRETRPFPVAGASQRAELLQNDAAVLILPFPDFRDHRLPTQIIAMLDFAGFLEGFFHDILRGNAGVVRAGKPHYLMAGHSCASRENVLNRVIEHVSHGQDASHVRRRNDDGIFRLWRMLISMETAALQPALIPLGFNVGGEIGSGEFGHGWVRENFGQADYSKLTGEVKWEKRRCRPAGDSPRDWTHGF